MSALPVTELLMAVERVRDPAWVIAFTHDGAPASKARARVVMSRGRAHAFTPDSLARLLRASGFTVNCSVNPENRSSFVMAADVVREEAACPA